MPVLVILNIRVSHDHILQTYFSYNLSFIAPIVSFFTIYFLLKTSQVITIFKMKTASRYSRQTILPEIGEIGQAKISNASVLCIGAGGLGCPALLYLAAAGVGEIGIVDFDSVDESNLQRQVLFDTSQIGQNKAKAAEARLKSLNPDIQIQSYAEELNDRNVLSLFGKYDVILDGSDNFSTKYLINDAAVKLVKPFIYASILGFKGQISVFNYNYGPCYRCLFPEPPTANIPNCAEAGVIGAVAGMMGTVQAMEAIKLIVGEEHFKPLSGKLWVMDMRSMDNQILALPKDQQCGVCSKQKDDIALQYSSPLCSFVEEISPAEICVDHQSILIDVRELNEWDAGHIDNARHIALSEMMKGLIPELCPRSDIILYCQKGKRGEQAAAILKEKGYENVRNMTGGYEAWLNF